MNEFFQSAFRRLRLLTLLIIVATLGFVIRIGDAFFEIKDLSASAYAEDTKPAEVVKSADNAAPPKDALPTVADSKSTPALKSAGESIKIPDGAGAKTAAAKNDKKPWEDSDSDFDDTKVRKEVYDDLMQRRQMIEQKEHDLDQREALLKAGNEEINKKVEELTAIKTEIQGLLKQQNAQDQANSDKLVKIYEGMKPKDAAKIFNQLDMDVLLNVVSKMSERKVSPVIALMDPQKAKALTDFLAQQNKMPGSGSTTAGFGNPNNPPSLPESAVK